MTSPRFRILTASVLGALAIHLTFTACAERSGPDRSSAGGGTAHAQTPPATPACAQWAVEAFVPSSFEWVDLHLTDSEGTPSTYSFPRAKPFDLPEGYEPFAGDSFGSVISRRCIKYAE